MTALPAASSLNEVERLAVASVDDAAILGDLRELVSIPSIDGAVGEPDAQAWCAARLTSLGVDVDAWSADLDALRREPDFPGMEVERDGLMGCVGVLGPTGVPALALCGHTDVVPADDSAPWPGGDPFRLVVDDGGRAWGRGVCDMKGGLAAAIGAVAAVVGSGLRLEHGLALHCVSAEEDGGLGAYATLRRGHLADRCVIAEPTAGDIVAANAGSLTFHITVEGQATHGATRTRGVSAIDKFEVVHAALRKLEDDRNADMPPPFERLDLAWPLSVGIVSAGGWASTVADRLVAEGRYGVRMHESIEDARSAFEHAVAEACASDEWLRDHPARIGWSGGVFAPGSLPTGHPLPDEVGAAARDVRGLAPSTVGAPYGSDLRHYAAAGVPTVQYGPGDVRFAHAVDEHVWLEDVYACARVYALLAVRLCGATA